MPAYPLTNRPVHLDAASGAVVEPEFTGMEWYEAYGFRHAADGERGRLVSMHTFTESWDAWEMHPAGDELVICTAGRIVLHQEHGGGNRETLVLEAGQYAINPAGIWHTADVESDATAVFVTPGWDTQHRPR